MNKNKNYILTYGTLRFNEGKGPQRKTYNFNRFGAGTQTPLSKLRIKGFEMYSLGPYPTIIKGNGDITVELHEVEDAAFQHIQRMENGAGYNEDLIKLKTDNLGEIAATIFYTTRLPQWSKIEKEVRRIESGDWCAAEK